jgi:hypothetical protein
MRLHRTLLIALLAIAVLPAAATASTRLTLRAADRAADRTASAIADDWEGDDGSAIDDYDLSDCDRVSKKKADCDVTYILDDGTECDDTIHVSLNRRGKPVTKSDSDDGDTQTFEDCTEPDDTGDDDGTDDGSLDDGDIPVDDGSDS